MDTHFNDVGVWSYLRYSYVYKYTHHVLPVSWCVYWYVYCFIDLSYPINRLIISYILCVHISMVNGVYKPTNTISIPWRTPLKNHALPGTKALGGHLPRNLRLLVWRVDMGDSTMVPCNYLVGNIWLLYGYYMVNIWLWWWLMMVNNISGWRFQPTPLKNDGVRQWEGWHPPYMKWKIKNIPNHQPEQFGFHQETLRDIS